LNRLMTEYLALRRVLIDNLVNSHVDDEGSEVRINRLGKDG
jgi:hypothetical protein